VSAQLSMWQDREAPESEPSPLLPEALLPSPTPAAGDRPYVLRPYQEEAVAASERELDSVSSTMVVMATGTGKSIIFTELARRRSKDRILFLAHRDELLQQAVGHFERNLGEKVGLDQAQFYGGDERIIIGSVQTVTMPARLERFDPKRFDLIITDELHHGVSPSYRRIYDYFSEAKRWGCTATADRLDEKAMGMISDSVAYVYDIQDAIRDGWLCDVRCSRIEIAGLDLSQVRTVAGDLNQGELDAVMKVEKVLLGVVDATIREAGNRPTIVFATSVENADKMAEIFRRHRKDCAFAVNGKTEIEERRRIMTGFREGKFQYLCQVAIATEGVDIPICACISMARPTKSRAFYAQAAGRALRPHPSKQDALILDFCGNSGRHRLVSALDILGGNYSDEEEELAQEIVRKTPGTRARDALEQAHAQAERQKQLVEAAAKKAAIKAHAIYNKQQVDPFAGFRVFHMDAQKEIEIAARFGGKIASDKQLSCLEKFKIPIPDGCTSQLASKLIGTAIARRQKNLASFGQLKTLQRAGINEINISFSRASQVIDALASNGWKPLPFQKLDAILHRQRQPGEDG
jgi:superfamily II DNA or RNA helicase